METNLPIYATAAVFHKKIHQGRTLREQNGIMKVVDDLFFSLNKGNMSTLALLDFSSAFDTIDHTNLVQCLHTDFGFTNTVLQWIHPI